MAGYMKSRSDKGGKHKGICTRCGDENVEVSNTGVCRSCHAKDNPMIKVGEHTIKGKNPSWGLHFDKDSRRTS